MSKGISLVGMEKLTAKLQDNMKKRPSKRSSRKMGLAYSKVRRRKLLLIPVF